MSSDPRVVIHDAIKNFIDSNAGMFASQAEAYIPGIVAALLAALAAHNLHIMTPAIPPVNKETPHEHS